MREIKFRAWDPINYYFVTCDFNTRIKVIVGDLYEKGLVQQFTGLHDKNGKEIYEGDIIRDQVGKCREVVWDDRGYWKGQHPTYSNFNGALFEVLADKQVEIEVIGNIYENPELLK